MNLTHNTLLPLAAAAAALPALAQEPPRRHPPRDPIERNVRAGLMALAAVAAAALVLYVASARSGADSAAAEYGSAVVDPHGMPPLAPTTDHAALSPSAVVVGDAQTVEASIAAYER